jgi:hypothetical protein
VIEALEKIYNGYHEETRGEFCEYIHTLRIALSSSLLATKSPADLKSYVAGILALNPEGNDIINAILEKPHGLFELDISNTSLTPSDISGMPELLPTGLPLKVIFANGERVRYG